MSDLKPLNAAHIAILAGNGILGLEDGRIKLKLQLTAFREGLQRADEIRRTIGALPNIFTVFDHRGSFDPFLADGCKKERHISLANINPGIASRFQDIASEFDIPLGEIKVIREGAARSYMEEIVFKGLMPAFVDMHCRREGVCLSFNDALDFLDGEAKERINQSALQKDENFIPGEHGIYMKCSSVAGGIYDARGKNRKVFVLLP